MSDQTDREAAMKYLKQVCVAIATLLVLYGIVQLLNFLSDLANVHMSYYLWLAFHVIAAVLIIFIGFRVYSVAKTIRVTHLIRLWREAHPQFLVPLLGCAVLLPFILYPLPASTFIHPQPFRPYSVHDSISFPYRLDYKWNLQSGGSVEMYTTYNYPTMPYKILVDIISTNQGWIVIPYEIDGSNAILEALGPARANINIGMIDNGRYIFKVVMSDAVDIFEIYKTDNRFWLEEMVTKRGKIVQKGEFEKRLDGFKVEFIGFPSIDNETRTFVLETIQEIGGEIIETKSYFEGWTVYVYFYYGGDLSSLRQIIREIATTHPKYMIGIHSNTGWYALTWVPDSYQ